MPRSLALQPVRWACAFVAHITSSFVSFFSPVAANRHGHRNDTKYHPLTASDKANNSTNVVPAASAEITEKSAPKKKWTKDEDKRLRALVEAHGESWPIVTKLLNGDRGQRTKAHCFRRWNKVRFL